MAEWLFALSIGSRCELSGKEGKNRAGEVRETGRQRASDGERPERGTLMSIRKTDSWEKVCLLIISHSKDGRLLFRFFSVRQKVLGQETCGEMQREGQNERGKEQKRKRQGERTHFLPCSTNKENDGCGKEEHPDQIDP